MAREKWSLGIDIGGSKILMGQVLETGQILHQRKINTNSSQGFSAIFKDILYQVQTVIETVSSTPKSIGIGIAGQIFEESYLINAPNLNWTNIPLKQKMTEFLDVPTFIINDVRAATWGEWQHGAGKGVENLICILIGTGIGGGIVAHNKLIKGSSGVAGELGHFPIDYKGPVCSCGNRGCFEALASGWSIAFQAKEIIKSNSLEQMPTFLSKDKADTFTAKEIVEASIRGDVFASHIIERAYEAIIAACIGFTNIFNPALILIGGGLGLALPNLCERIHQGINTRSLEAARIGLEVKYTELKDNVVAIGAASYAANKLQGTI